MLRQLFQTTLTNCFKLFEVHLTLTYNAIWFVSHFHTYKDYQKDIRILEYVSIHSTTTLYLPYTNPKATIPPVLVPIIQSNSSVILRPVRRSNSINISI